MGTLLAKRGVRPKCGYWSIQKAKYREWVWNEIRETLDHHPTESPHVAIMPSLEGREIFDALCHREFQPTQLHIIDRNPAIVATLARRYPGIHTYGVDVGKAFARMDKQKVNLRFANIDYCSNICPDVVRSLRAIGDSTAAQFAKLFVTVLRGREGGILGYAIGNAPKENIPSDMWRVLAASPWPDVQQRDSDALRLLVISAATGRLINKCYAYKSTNGQTFLTVVLQPMCLLNAFERDKYDKLLWAMLEGEHLPPLKNVFTNSQLKRVVHMMEKDGFSEMSALMRERYFSKQFNHDQKPNNQKNQGNQP